MSEYKPSEGYVITREQYIKEFINATDAYTRYSVFMKLLQWMDTTQELMYWKDNADKD